MKKQYSFLLVEDNSLDVEKVERSFKKLRILNPLINAKNGLEALDYIRGTGNKEKIEGPYIILLDLNMPKMNGIEFLSELRKDKEISSAPVFVLTTSDSKKDISEAHKYNVCGYIVKPIKRHQMLEALEVLNSFWELCEFPEGESV